MPPTKNEPDQPIRLAIWLGDALRRVELRGTVWGAHTRPARLDASAPEQRVGRVKYGGREYEVLWREDEGAWSHLGTRMQYDPNEQGE